MTAKMKLFLQFSHRAGRVWIVTVQTPPSVRFWRYHPYFPGLLNLGWFYLPFAMIVIAGASNAVNLSDGLDGLAGGLSLIAFSAFALIAFVTGIPAMNTVSGVFIPAPPKSRSYAAPPSGLPRFYVV